VPAPSTDARILDAALAAIAGGGLAGLGLEQVAGRAGVSRQTVYRRFGSRDGLVRAVVAREEQRLLDAVLAAAAGHDDLERALAAAIAALLRGAVEHPLLQRLLAEEPAALLPLLASRDAGVLDTARGAVAAVLRGRGVHPSRAAVAADVLARVLLSSAIDPPAGAPEAVAADLASFVVRGLGAG
jgi:AcrR family transcriptional regulator